MSLETCVNCDHEFLTEADDYVVIPREAYALRCVKCYFKKELSPSKTLADNNLRLVLENDLLSENLFISNKSACDTERQVKKLQAENEKLKKENEDLKKQNHLKDLDIELIIGKLALVKKFVDESQQFESWQTHDELKERSEK